VAPVSALPRPLVTVCIPTTGRLPWLRQAIAGAFAQAYAPIEVIVLDNASGEEAQAALRDAMRAHPGLRVLRSGERLPMFANFNRGIGAAAGEYLAFFHDDDEYDPRFLARHVALLEAHPTATFAAGNFDVIAADGRLLRRYQAIRETGLWSGRRLMEWILARGQSPFSTPGITFRRSALGAAGFDESLPMNWGDFTILMRLAERGDVAVVAEPLMRWRVHGGNASLVRAADAIPLRTAVLARYLEEFAARHPAEGATIARYRSLLARSHARGLLRGWFSASSLADARASRHRLRHTRLGWITPPLAALEAVGVAPRLTHRIPQVVRRLADRLGFS
jgi:glycosyltransferase involved in cell wall biosynthesis